MTIRKNGEEYRLDDLNIEKSASKQKFKLQQFSNIDTEDKQNKDIGLK